MYFGLDYNECIYKLRLPKYWQVVVVVAAAIVEEAIIQATPNHKNNN